MTSTFDFRILSKKKHIYSLEENENKENHNQNSSFILCFLIIRLKLVKVISIKKVKKTLRVTCIVMFLKTTLDRERKPMKTWHIYELAICNIRSSRYAPYVVSKEPNFLGKFPQAKIKYFIQFELFKRE